MLYDGSSTLILRKMNTRKVVRCIGNRVFTLTLVPYATEAELEISVYPNAVEACLDTQRQFSEVDVEPVADYYVIKPGFSSKGLVCSHIRACGMAPYWLHTGHVLVRKDYISNSLIEHVGCEYAEGYDALDDIDLYFKSRSMRELDTAQR